MRAREVVEDARDLPAVLHNDGASRPPNSARHSEVGREVDAPGDRRAELSGGLVEQKDHAPLGLLAVIALSCRVYIRQSRPYKTVKTVKAVWDSQKVM